VRKTALAALALAGLGSTFLTLPAHAAVDDPGPGLICQFSSNTDPTAEAGTQTGQISGGPLVVQDSTTLLPGSGTLFCWVQVNSDTPAGPPGSPGTSGHGTGVVVAPEQQITYTTATVTDNVYLCSAFTDDSSSTTYYWQDATSEWTTDPGHCSLAISAGPPDPGPLDPVFQLIDDTFNTLDEFEKANIDPVICPILKQLLPPEGDIPLIWDCPVYGNN
jgi:hypothetical protein